MRPLEIGVGVMGTKMGTMTHFTPQGNAVGITGVGFLEGNVVQVGSRRVRHTKFTELGLGHLKKVDFRIRHLQEYKLTSAEGFKPGQKLKLDGLFKEGDLVDVAGKRGNGFTGGIKRWHFARGARTYGSKSYRQLGSIGAVTNPAGVNPGIKMPDRLEGTRNKIRKIESIKAVDDRHAMLRRRALPGKAGNLLCITLLNFACLQCQSITPFASFPDVGWITGRKSSATKKKKASADEKEKEKDNQLLETNLDTDRDDEEEEVMDWPPLVCCFGEALYEFLPSVRISKKRMDPEIYSTWKGLQWGPPEFARLPGSFPSNVAVALARLGGRVAFMGKVGDDEHGRDLVLQLNTNGVQTRAVKFDSSCSTGVSRLRLTNGDGKVHMTCVRPSAENSFVKSEINMDVLKESRFFQFTSFSLTSEPICSTLFLAIKEAKRNGADIIFDVNLPLRYWRSVSAARELIQAAWKESNIVEVTKQEVEFILGEEYYEVLRQKGPAYFSDSVEQTKKRRYHYHYEPEELAPLWHKKMKFLFITDGTYRIHYYTADFHGSVAGTEDVLVTPFTCDRTGSGDAVIAAIMRKLSTQPELYHDEEKLQKALRFCLCAGIIAQWTKGAIRGMPTESATQNLTEQVYPHYMIF